MTRLVHCTKLGREAEGLPRPPLPGPLGERVFAQISKEVWRDWLAHQTRLINEYRLSLADPQARAFLTKELETYLFGSGELTRTGYTPPPSP